MDENLQLDALLIGYENQENLGLRSIKAYLDEHGLKAELVPFFPGRHVEVLAAIERCHPRLVGFSVIFQYTLEDFGRLMQYLRANGVKVHFTAGGHFPSLRPKEILDLIPELDSIVRFEGELTLLDLLSHLDQPDQWENILGLIYRVESNVILNEPRPLVPDLDSLPPVYRDEPKLTGNGLRMASMLASRGCLFNCSFCSIRQFYGCAPGALRRSRSPQLVAQEMFDLYWEKEVCFFTFQDDDFAARTPRQREWLEAFLEELERLGLSRKISWKISCRVDDLQPAIVEKMMEYGLIAVYLGVESGSETGLRTLNKHVSVAQNLAAIELLKDYDMALAIGFMLFDPSSTLETIRENLDFLSTVGEDGYFPINFCKMLPYAGTPIEQKLRETGRLKGSLTRPDYDFLDPQLDWYAFLVQRIFTRRNFHPDGLVGRLQQADFDYRLARFFELISPSASYETSLRSIISRSNRQALATLRELLNAIVSQGVDVLLNQQQQLLAIADKEWRVEAECEAELNTAMRELSQGKGYYDSSVKIVAK